VLADLDGDGALGVVGSGGLAVFCFAGDTRPMDERLASLLADLQRAEDLAGADLNRAARRAAWVAEFLPQQLDEFLIAVGQLPLPLAAETDRLLANWLVSAVHARRKGARSAAASAELPAGILKSIESLYRGLGPTSRARGQLLAWLSSGGSSPELALFGGLLLEDPPHDDQDVVQALAPLFQRQRNQAELLFPRLLNAISSPALAAPILDLANFLTRERLVAAHPAKEVAGELIELLGELAQILLVLEERPDQFGDSPQELSRRVARSVALAVSLCDALALIGDKNAIGKLYQSLQVGHRRLRTEAAAALARLGDEQGVTELVALAAEPVARLRVLAYGEELGICDKIDPQYATPQARAEAELSVWLAEPTQYGVPPTSCELFDHRKQHWPGFDDPIDCFLFQFQYVLTVEGQEQSFSNIGIAGPLVHAFVADFGDLPADDIYAAFAGWHAQHADIREVEVERLSKSQQLEVERLKRRLSDEGYAAIEPQRMGYFFGEKVLIALAERQDVAGVAVADFKDTLFFPQRHSRRPIGVEEAYSIYKGRKLLRAFNR
jgi:hypothetical protein